MNFLFYDLASAVNKFCDNAKFLKMRRHQPFIYIIFGAVLGGLAVFQITNHSTSNTTNDHELTRADRVELGNPNIHAQDHDHKGEKQERLFAFQHEHEDSDVVKALKENVRVSCWIMSGPNNLQKALAVNATWAPKCNKYIFITATKESGLPSVDLNVADGRQHLWEKTKRAFKYLYDTDLNNYDWFLKGDDDSFFIMENLRFMLLAYSPDDPVYFGCKFRPLVKQGYMSGGSGYVLSREALKRFVEQGLPDPKKCKKAESGAEDAEMGKCMQNVGIHETKDGKHRMLPLSPTAHYDVVTGNKSPLPGWFNSYIYYPYKTNDECCSDYMISFHYVSKSTMYSLYNNIYHMRAFGVTDDSDQMAKQRTSADTQLLQTLKDMAKNSSRPFEEMIEEREPRSWHKEKLGKTLLHLRMHFYIRALMN
ncbi:N-acetylgalactosaminide beta-1,3-galactosyltransferase [Aphelenchoides bicaudatus]|nr:N-acetylgalactosaminide beta-1,3-galactosyltransferase [Aphelenchoides bicaudatus]